MLKSLPLLRKKHLYLEKQHDGKQEARVKPYILLSVPVSSEGVTLARVVDSSSCSFHYRWYVMYVIFSEEIDLSH